MSGYNERNAVKKAAKDALRAEKDKVKQLKKAEAEKQRKAELSRDWRVYFKLPVFVDSYGMYMFDDTNQMVCMISSDIEDDPEMHIVMHMAAAVMNQSWWIAPQSSGLRQTDWEEKTKAVWCNKLKSVKAVPEAVVDEAGRDLIIARGWGYLNGSLKLPNEVAAEIQDGLMREIAEGMNKMWGGAL